LPRTKEQYEAMRNATKEKIQTTAIQLFSQKGFAATSVQDIADKAGISTGLMYRHYKSKEDLFSSLVLEAVNGLKQLIERFKSNISPQDLLKEFTIEILNDLSKDDRFAQFTVLMAQSFMMDGVIPQVQNLMEINSALIEQTACLIQKGQSLNQFKQGNPKEMAIYYFAAVQGLAEMKFALKERFIAPSPKIMNAFLIKED
jgi:AcrR family transcriptional regulator